MKTTDLSFLANYPCRALLILYSLCGVILAYTLGNYWLKEGFAAFENVLFDLMAALWLHGIFVILPALWRNEYRIFLLGGRRLIIEEDQLIYFNPSPLQRALAKRAFWPLRKV